MTLKASDYTIEGVTMTARRSKDSPDLAQLSLSDFLLEARLLLNRPSWREPIFVTIGQNEQGRLVFPLTPMISASASHAIRVYLGAVFELQRSLVEQGISYGHQLGYLFYVLDMRSHLQDGGKSWIRVRVGFEVAKPLKLGLKFPHFLWIADGDWRQGKAEADAPLDLHRPELIAYCHGIVRGLDRIMTLGQPLADLAERQS